MKQFAFGLLVATINARQLAREEIEAANFVGFAS